MNSYLELFKTVPAYFMTIYSFLQILRFRSNSQNPLEILKTTFYKFFRCLRSSGFKCSTFSNQNSRKSWNNFEKTEWGPIFYLMSYFEQFYFDTIMRLSVCQLCGEVCCFLFRWWSARWQDMVLFLDPSSSSIFFSSSHPSDSSWFCQVSIFMEDCDTQMFILK